MGGGDREDTAGFIGKHIGQAADFARLIQDAFGNGQQRFTRLGHPQQTFTAADKDLHAKFIFQIPDVPTHTRLGGKERVSDFR